MGARYQPRCYCYLPGALETRFARHFCWWYLTGMSKMHAGRGISAAMSRAISVLVAETQTVSVTKNDRVTM